MNKMFLSMVLICAFYGQAPAQTTYFSYDAETVGPLGSGCTRSTCWSDAQSHVTRSQTRVKNGAWALRYEMPDNTNDQTGKVIVFTSGFVPLQATTYYSAWYYLDRGNHWDGTNPDRFWNNMFQFKHDWGTAKEPKQTTPGVKAVLGFQMLNGIRRVSFGVSDCELPADVEFSTTNWPPERPSWGGRCRFVNKTSPNPIPKQKWFHLEVKYKHCDPNRLGSQATHCSGALEVWVDGNLEMSVSHPNFNTLTTFKTIWSNNAGNYWGIGMYGSTDPLITFPAVLYTDDAKITDYRVYPTYSKISSSPPRAPSGLTAVSP